MTVRARRKRSIWAGSWSLLSRAGGTNSMEVKRGQLLRVKAPPLFEKEYLYVVTGAGGKMIRADLRNSPKVKKQWTQEEFDLSIKHGIVRLVDEE